jgi:hypothetical protein
MQWVECLSFFVFICYYLYKSQLYPKYAHLCNSKVYE